MYEGVCIIVEADERQILFEIISHNLATKERTDEICRQLAAQGEKPVLFRHALQHPCAPFNCKSCLSALEEMLREVEAQRAETNRKAGLHGGNPSDPPPFDPSAKGLALVVPSGEEQVLPPSKEGQTNLEEPAS